MISSLSQRRSRELDKFIPLVLDAFISLALDASEAFVMFVPRKLVLDVSEFAVSLVLLLAVGSELSPSSWGCSNIHMARVLIPDTETSRPLTPESKVIHL